MSEQLQSFTWSRSKALRSRATGFAELLGWLGLLGALQVLALAT